MADFFFKKKKLFLLTLALCVRRLMLFSLFLFQVIFIFFAFLSPSHYFSFSLVVPVNSQWKFPQLRYCRGDRQILDCIKRYWDCIRRCDNLFESLNPEVCHFLADGIDEPATASVLGSQLTSLFQCVTGSYVVKLPTVSQKLTTELPRPLFASSCRIVWPKHVTISTLGCPFYWRFSCSWSTTCSGWMPKSLSRRISGAMKKLNVRRQASIGKLRQ